ncbi:MAG: hypothetical protein H6757_02470 [Candidatus Omnitrophica bacterium]|nr:hypothetical protein [Candidatus Omnitrophota bacterium]
MATAFLMVIAMQPLCHAKSAAEIDAGVDTALERFTQEVKGSRELMAKAKAVLVMPRVVKAGIGIGGEYGEGALRIDGKTAEYYNTIGGSIGFQLGAQVKSIYLIFMEDKALQQFRFGEGWEVGVDGSVALVTVGVNGEIDTTKTNQPIMAFVLGQKGLMYNLTLEGSKFNKIKK